MSLVYSTDAGRICPDCRRPQAQCSCKAVKRPEGDGIVRVSREKRSGKVVTLAKGLALEAGELAAFAKQLKAACGSGGTVKDWVIEIQGDHVDKVMQAIRTINQRFGTTILMVEQNVRYSLPIADRVAVLKTGLKIYDGPPEPLHDRVELIKLF